MATVSERFIEAYGDIILARKASVRQFCRDLGVDRRNFQREIKSGKLRVRAEWLGVLATKYSVSPTWLLTGESWIFGE